MSSKTRQISAAEWESHKDLIFDLRRSGISLESIVESMKTDRDFIATPSQYTLQLSKWGDRKNLSPSDWRDVMQIADHYDDQGWRYKVYKNNQLVSNKELKRKRKEHCKGDDYARSRRFRASVNRLPESIKFKLLNIDSGSLETGDFDGHGYLSASAPGDAASTTAPTTVIATPHMATDGGSEIDASYLRNQIPGVDRVTQDQEPTTSGALSAPGGALQDPGPSSPRSMSASPSDAPCNDAFVQEMTNNQLSLSRRSSSVISQASLHLQLDAARNLYFGTLSPVRSDPMLGAQSLIKSSNSPDNISQVDISDFLTSNFPLHTEELMESQGDSNDSLQHRRPPRSSSTQTFDHVETLPLVQQGAPFSSERLVLTDMVKSSLSSLLSPDNIPPEFLLDTRTAAQSNIFGSSFYRSLICSIGNNFAGLDGVPIGAVLAFVKQDPQMHSPTSMFSAATSAKITKALAENLILAAIENCDAGDVAQQLRDGALNPNEIVYTVNGRRYTAVERSAMLGSFQVTKALLFAGADPNKTYAIDSYARKGALALAVVGRGGGSRDDVVDLRLVNLLLGRDTKVSVDLVLIAMRLRGEDLIKTLMPKLSPFEHSKTFKRGGLMDDAVLKLDSVLATMIVKQMFQLCTQTHCGDCPKSNPGGISALMTLAVSKGIFELVQFLVDYVTNETLPLADAVRSGRKDIIDFLLEKGANIDAPRIDIYISGITLSQTPLAEAIRAGNSELVQLFESRGALSRINERGRFCAAITAASEVGDLTYVQKLLREGADVHGEILGQALYISTSKGYTEIALTLLNAGADVNRPNSSMLVALRQRNRTVVQKIMECDLDVSQFQNREHLIVEATRWGDFPIIQDLMTMGADVNRDSTVLFGETAVTAAVRARNMPLVRFFVEDHGARLDLPRRWKNSPVEAAISNNDTEMLQYLLKLGADPLSHCADNAKFPQDRKSLTVISSAFRERYPAGKKGFGNGALQSALQEGDDELLDMLLEAKFDVNAIFQMSEYDTTMQSALGVAIARNGGRNLDIIKKLISAGGDVNSVVSAVPKQMSATVWPRQTALLQAIHQKNKALVELLIDEGADIHRAARLGLKRTPLQYACEVGSPEIVELLLEKGADVNEEPATRGGATSLQLCAIKGYCGIAIKLLAKGVNVYAAPAQVNGQTPFDGAAEHGRFNMLMFLSNVGVCKGFERKDWERARKLAEYNGHIVCRDVIRELSLNSLEFITQDSSDF